MAIIEYLSENISYNQIKFVWITTFLLQELFVEEPVKYNVMSN